MERLPTGESISQNDEVEAIVISELTWSKPDLEVLDELVARDNGNPLVWLFNIDSSSPMSGSWRARRESKKPQSWRNILAINGLRDVPLKIRGLGFVELRAIEQNNRIVRGFCGARQEPGRQRERLERPAWSTMRSVRKPTGP
jgi:hypothetical protein